jgi:hypothetical protein
MRDERTKESAGGEAKRARFGAARLAAVFLVAAALSGCAASRSDIRGAYEGPVSKNTGAEKVSVFFLFHHLGQQRGLDAIPKLKNSGVKDFNNLFRDALGELGNVGAYETDVERPDDVNNPQRRENREARRRSHDFTVEMTFLEESSFAQGALSGVVTLLSLSIIPVPYTWDYSLSADIYDRAGKPVRSYKRSARLYNWVEALLVFAYPFYPLDGKREEIYAGVLHDAFRQIEAEGVLRK